MREGYAVLRSPFGSPGAAVIAYYRADFGMELSAFACIYDCLQVRTVS
jgi:hypothetical protein